jgi:hypothetical protein
MPHQEERSASALAHGPAKPGDIERARRDVEAAVGERAFGEVERALGEVEATCQSIRDDLSGLKRAPRP